MIIDTDITDFDVYNDIDANISVTQLIKYQYKISILTSIIEQIYKTVDSTFSDELKLLMIDDIRDVYGIKEEK